MIFRAQFGVHGDGELLERAAVPKIGLQAIAIELPKLIGEVIGGQVDAFGAQSPTFALVGREKAVGGRQSLFDGSGLVAASAGRS